MRVAILCHAQDNNGIITPNGYVQLRSMGESLLHRGFAAADIYCGKQQRIFQSGQILARKLGTGDSGIYRSHDIALWAHRAGDSPMALHKLMRDDGCIVIVTNAKAVEAARDEFVSLFSPPPHREKIESMTGYEMNYTTKALTFLHHVDAPASV